jgi:Lar family restriction alleviation protein
MTDLLPCPFCGCPSLWLGLDDAGRATVECNWCDAIGPYVSRHQAGGDEDKALSMAAELWNTRPPQVVTIELSS